MTPIPTDPAALEVWFNDLPSDAQSKLINRTQALYRALPVALQQVVQRHLVEIGETPPVAPLNGYDMVGGLGQWAALAMSLAQMGSQIGTSLYSSKEQADLQRDLQSSALSTNAAIVNAQNQAALQAQQILADAQKATAESAATALQAQADASLFGGMTAKTKATIVIAGLGVVGLVAFLALRRKRAR